MQHAKYICFLVVFLIFLGHFAFTQTDLSTRPFDVHPDQIRSRHSLHLEVAGRGFIFGTLNYEYALLPRMYVGAGLGLANISTGDILRNNNGMDEAGRYFEMSSSQLIYGNYMIRDGKHKIFLTTGITNFLVTSRNKYPSETESSNEAFLRWNAGVGYQFSGERVYFRATAYLLNLPNSDDFFPGYIPWGGLTVGVWL
ncbi:MAG: hypothetical protein AAGI23_19950 [Bacteroidota bacterium]